MTPYNNILLTFFNKYDKSKNMENEILLDSTNLKKQIKTIAKAEGINMTMLKVTINAIFNKTDGVRNLYNKLTRKTVRVSELEEIAEVLNYEIILRKKA